MARTAASDPLEKFRFLVSIAYKDKNDTEVTWSRAGFHDVQMPKRTTSKIMYREGHFPDISSLSAGLSTMEDIVLSRGVITETNSDFYKWISAVHAPTAGFGDADFKGATSTAGAKNSSSYRADVTITMLDRSGTSVRIWKVYNAFPTHFVPGSDLNAAEDGEKSMESLTLAYEDFQETTPQPKV